MKMNSSHPSNPEVRENRAELLLYCHVSNNVRAAGFKIYSQESKINRNIRHHSHFNILVIPNVTHICSNYFDWWYIKI